MSELPALAWIDSRFRKNEFRVLKKLDFPDPTGPNNSILICLITSCDTPISLNGQYSSTSFFNRFNSCRWKLKAFHTWINKKKLVKFCLYLSSSSKLEPSLSWSYGSWIYNYLCNRLLSPLVLLVRMPLRARCTILYDKVCKWLAAGR